MKVLLGFQIEDTEMIALKEEATRRRCGHTSLAREVLWEATKGFTDFSILSDRARLAPPKNSLTVEQIRERASVIVNEVEEVPYISEIPTFLHSPTPQK